MSRQTVKMILFLIVTLTPFAWGQADVNELQALSDYLQYAALNSADLKSGFEQWKAALQQVPQARALDDPRFTYSYFIKEVETRVGPQRNKFSITQTFPWFGKIQARTDAASANANVARQNYEAVKVKLFQQVKNAFYEFSYLATAIDIAKENLQLLTHFEEVARIKYRASAATHPDLIRAQIELAKLEDILKSLVELKEPTVAKMNSVLDRRGGFDLSWPKKLQIVDINLPRETIISKVVSQNPELAQIDWQKQAAQAGAELAKKKFYPDIGVGVDWTQTDGAAMPGVRDSGKDPVALMFTVNIPLWRDSYKAAERQAKAKVRQYQFQKLDMQNRKISQALEIIYNIEDAKRKINLYGNFLVPKSQELIQTSESAYRAGTVDFLSLIDAQRTLLQYQLNYHRAITDHLQNIARLEALAGEEFLF